MLLGGSLRGLLNSDSLSALRNDPGPLRGGRRGLLRLFRYAEERKRETDGSRKCDSHNVFLNIGSTSFLKSTYAILTVPSTSERPVSGRRIHRHTDSSRRSSSRTDRSTPGSRSARTADRPGRRALERDRHRPGMALQEPRHSARRRNASSPARARLKRGASHSRVARSPLQEQTASPTSSPDPPPSDDSSQRSYRAMITFYEQVSTVSHETIYMEREQSPCQLRGTPPFNEPTDGFYEACSVFFERVGAIRGPTCARILHGLRRRQAELVHW